jgi:hypothetical protein
MAVKSSTVFLACLALAACNYVGQNNPPRPHYQRFVPVPREETSAGMPRSAAFALDTKTGQLCWTYKGISSEGNAQIPGLPDCTTLYHNDPD